MNATKSVMCQCWREAARRCFPGDKIRPLYYQHYQYQWLGAELDRAIAYTGAYNSENSDASAAAGPDGPSAKGPNASASSESSAFGGITAGAAAGHNGAAGTGTASGYARSGTSGATPISP
ncbi:unnamed protein product [Eruca vesicaria subsp. sativa]|uniref:Uncharacterized protein n=1 Tax=Eruca vesicaria subsp. sativa TaxID=29727 RepID=A0ABC8J2W7_ERUVS|nr:unnamed protein product [Eruca vesicaria subsp. sativa]